MKRGSSSEKASPRRLTAAWTMAAAWLLVALCLAVGAGAAGAESIVITREPDYTAIVDGGYGGADGATDVAVTADGVWFVGSREGADGESRATIGRCAPGPSGWTVALRTYAGLAGVNEDFSSLVARGRFVYAAGSSWTEGPEREQDMLIARWPVRGGVKWVRRLAGVAGADDYPTDMAVDAEGNVIVCATTRSTTGDIEMLVLKYSPRGELRWRWRYVEPTGARAAPTGMVVDGSGSIYVTGWSRSNGGFDGEALVVKLSPAGATRWTRTYAGPMDSGAGARAIAPCPRGGVYVGGEMYAGATGWDVFVHRYSAGGRCTPLDPYTGSGEDLPQRLMDLAVAANGDVVAAAADAVYDLPAPVYREHAAYLRWADGPAGSLPTPGTLVETLVSDLDDAGWWQAIATDRTGGVYLTGGVDVTGTQTGAVTRRFSVREGGPEWRHVWGGPEGHRVPSAIACRGRIVAVCGTAAVGPTSFDQFVHVWAD